MRERELSTFCIVPHCSRSAAFCQSFKAFRLGLEPGVNLLRRAQFLRNVARFIDEIEHHLVLDRLAELVGVDVAAEDFEAGLLVLLQERRAGEADEHGARQQRLHRLVQLAALGAMALVHEDEQLADRRARLLLQFLDERIEIIHALLAELVDKRAEQARLGLAKLRHQIVPAAGAVDGLARVGEHALDLFVEFVAVGEDEHAGVGFVLQNPLGQAAP